MAESLAWVLRTSLVVGGRDLAEGHSTGLAQDLGCAQGRRFCPRHHRRPLRNAPGGEVPQAKANPRPVTPGGALSRRERLALAAGEPFLPPETRDLLVRDLMQARRAVLTARRSGSLDDLSAAHARIDAAKRALGERGPVW